MKRGFTLVELSIVLVILGLLVGGILAGQSLIRAAELRSITEDSARYHSAVINFKQRYKTLPGDLPTATEIWGEAHPTPATCWVTQGTGTQTCNGNDDGVITDYGHELYRSWQHLANAGLIEGSFTGIKVAGGDATWNVAAGVNVPGSKVDRGAWTMRNFPDYTDTNWYDLPTAYGNIMQFGRWVAGSWNEGAILKPEEMWSIDTKMDDGVPGTGKIMVLRWTQCTDAANATDLTAGYDLDLQTLSCAMIFRGMY